MLDKVKHSQEHLETVVLHRQLPPDEVIGYLGTYDKLPIGYLPTIEDLEYLTL